MVVRDEIKGKIQKIKDLKEQIAKLEKEVKPSFRNLQKTSGGTFFLCLPKDWCHKHGLEKGSIITLSEQEDCLIIVP